MPPTKQAEPLAGVPISAVSPERFRPLLGDEYAEIDEAIVTARTLLAGRVVWHINSTARGGGVAEMLQSLLAYARGAGADMRWMTIAGNDDFFHVTKRIHNNLHESPGDGGPLGEAEREVYEDALGASAAALADLVRPGDIVYLHDPQTAGLIGAIRELDVRIIWRCHVGIDSPGELAKRTWAFLLPHVRLADACVFSREEFVWDGLDRARIWIVPPSIDVFSAKNQEMDPGTVGAILTTIGLSDQDHDVPPIYEKRDGSVARVDRPAAMDQETFIPADAPLLVQVSRWDRLKDPIGVLRCFAEHVEHPDAHLLLAGPSVAEVADDPEGSEVLSEVLEARNALPAGIRERTHLASLPMDAVEENAAMVNAIQRRAQVVLQKSLAEGFGLTVAEAMWKARPVIAGRVGGIQDQIEDGKSGLLVDDAADLPAVGRAVDELLSDRERAAKMGVAGHERVVKDFLGTRHLVQYLNLIERMLNHPSN